MGQKLRYGRPCTCAHVTYQAPITGLHSPTLLPFLQNSTGYSMLAQSCNKFGVNCCFNCWQGVSFSRRRPIDQDLYIGISHRRRGISHRRRDTIFTCSNTSCSSLSHKALSFIIQAFFRLVTCTAVRVSSLAARLKKTENSGKIS
jgi:hypothetical protein